MLDGLTKQFSELWKPLGINQKISLTLAAGLVALSMIAMFIWASKPEMQLLYGGLSDGEAGEILSKLEQKGYSSEMGKGGGAIYVDASQVHKIRAELATEGILPGGTGPGFELFDAGGFGISDFVQRTNFLRAVQGELARTIAQFSGVKGARVMVVMPENRIVVSNEGRDRPTASVFVDTSGGLTQASVNAIRRLVANAIQGLNINDVAVVDSSGIDWTAEMRSEGITGISNEAIRFRTKWESYFTTKVQTMLDNVLGSNQSEVRVAVDIDTSSSEVTETSFDPESQVARSTTTRENTNNSRENTGGGAGVGIAANVETAEGANGNLSESNDKNKEVVANYEISGVVKNQVQAPGGIRRITASLLVAKRYSEEGGEQVLQPRNEQELNDLRQIVVNALGIDVSGGLDPAEVVTVQEMDFAPDPMAYKFDEMSNSVDISYYLDMAKGFGGIALGIGVIIFFLKMLKSNQPEKISLEVLQPEQMLNSKKMEDTSSVTPDMLNELIKQKPANIGVSLKEWVGDMEGAK
ncbi:flagellar M-ring protein FliF [Puniceicoccaceae bacterium K14]|nr:flagellar M-ring protein FliF [Puniceicoccaceae bacterium K14]